VGSTSYAIYRRLLASRCPSGRYRSNQFWQAIEHERDALGFPDPAALSVRPSLAKILWLKSNDLEQQLPAGVQIVIDRHDCPAITFGRR
jgi:hypothetical protein